LTSVVTVNWPAIRRWIGKTGGRATMVQLSPPAKHASPQAQAALRAAVEQSEPGASAGPMVLAITPAARGPVMTFASGLDADVLRTWLEELASRLQSAGVAGTLRPPPTQWEANGRFVHPTERRGLVFPTAMAGFRLAKYPHAHTADTLRFMVDPDTVAALASRFVAWGVQLADARAYAVRVVHSTVLGPGGLDEWLTASAADTVGLTVLAFLVPGQDRGRRLTLSQLGQAVVWAAEAGHPWPDAVADLRDWLTADPDALDQAHVRNGTIGMSNFSSLEYDMCTPGHTPPRVFSVSLIHHRHLWERHVIDAAGLQILTRDHLDRAHDLTGWTITPLTATRFLVEADDLAPWFAQESPDLRVLDAARTAFGDMILTPQHIAETPGPYT
jgi:hypothetical protein